MQIAGGSSVLRWRRACGYKPDCDSPGLDRHHLDPLHDQIAVGNAGSRFVCRYQVALDALDHERLNLGRRHAPDAASFALPLVQDGMRDIVPVTHTTLV